MSKPSNDIVDVVYVLQNLGPALKAVRLTRGLSLRQVARECGESPSTVYRVENGDNCNITSAVSLLLWIRGESGE